ncbi:MAG TPA: hypothetical protein VFH00_10915 [Candidatus Nitrosotalea sp.]|nr:hypothetical protein [Candidatus Nitrosotalea sp.]
MGSRPGGPPSTQEVPDWLPKPDPVAVVDVPPPVLNAPPFAAPPPPWQAPASPSRLPLIAGIGAIALVLIGAAWFLRDSTFLHPTADVAVQSTPTPTGPFVSQYDRADRILNKVLAPHLAVIQDKLNQGAGACSSGGACQRALENVEPALAKAVADLDAADPPKCIATELLQVRRDLSEMDKSALGAIAMMKTGQDDYGRTMAAAVGRIQSQLQLDMSPLKVAASVCPRA